MVKIAKDGTYLETDAKGFFSNNLPGQIIKPWSEAVKVLVEECKKSLGDKLHSVYIRGSVATGKAVERVSDIDSIIVVRGNPKNLNLDWAKQAKRKILNEGFATKVETMFVNLENLFDEERSFNTGFLIKIQSICVYGESLQTDLPDYRPNRKLALNLHGRWIEGNIEHAKVKLSNSKSEKEISNWCSWVSKRIVRAGFALIIEKEKKYTRDLYLSYRDFSKYYFEKESEMKTALLWAIEPTPDKKEILQFLNSFGKWLVKETHDVLLEN